MVDNFFLSPHVSDEKGHIGQKEDNFVIEGASGEHPPVKLSDHNQGRSCTNIILDSLQI